MSEISKKNDKDLQKMLSEKKEAARKFRFGVAGSSIKDVKELRNTKKEIAQILTELRAREIKEGAGQSSVANND